MIAESAALVSRFSDIIKRRLVAALRA